MVSLVFLFACDPGVGSVATAPPTGVTTSTPTTPPPPPDPELALTGPPAFDPLVAPATLDVEPAWGASVTVELLDAEGAAVTSWAQDLPADEGSVLSFTVDGRDGAGAWLVGGQYTARATLWGSDGAALLTVDHPLGVVRAGFQAAWLDDDDGLTAERVPLYWYLSDTLQDEADAVATLAALEDAKGLPQDFAEATAELAQAPATAPAWPSAFTAGSRPLLTLLPGDVTVLGATGLDAVDVGVEAEGWTVLSGLPLRPGQPVVLQRDEGLGLEAGITSGPVATVGVTDELVQLSFHAVDGQGAFWDLGHQVLPVRFYRTFDAPTFAEDGGRYSAWVAAVDPALRALEGTPAERVGVTNALVEWIYTDLGLAYDTRRGASAYTTYGWSWSTGHFYMSDFLRRRFGTTVNCSDCAGILTSYGNMLGTDLSYLIILENFDLNYIKAIGGSAFTHCPFGGNGCGFSYHAVTTLSDTDQEAIFDATLALDGDDNPSAPDHTELLVQEVPAEEYLWRLVMEGQATYNYESKGTLQ